MSKVYQCDRCKTIFEPRVLANGEPYIARKGKADLDLCPSCYKLFTDFIAAQKNTEIDEKSHGGECFS